jgi:predicted ester cyclase
MSLEDNKTVVRRLVEEAIIQGNFDVLHTSFAPNLTVHYSNTPPHTHTSFKKLVEQFHQAMAGHSATFHDLIAEGDAVAMRLSYVATSHHRHFGHNPPTGQPLQVGSNAFFHFDHGKVTEVWVYLEGANWDLTPDAG